MDLSERVNAKLEAVVFGCNLLNLRLMLLQFTQLVLLEVTVVLALCETVYVLKGGHYVLIKGLGWLDAADKPYREVLCLLS
jgi:hypothetical protein